METEVCLLDAAQGHWQRLFDAERTKQVKPAHHCWTFTPDAFLQLERPEEILNNPLQSLEHKSKNLFELIIC